MEIKDFKKGITVDFLNDSVSDMEFYVTRASYITEVCCSVDDELTNEIRNRCPKVLTGIVSHPIYVLGVGLSLDGVFEVEFYDDVNDELYPNRQHPHVGMECIFSGREELISKIKEKISNFSCVNKS